MNKKRYIITMDSRKTLEVVTEINIFEKWKGYIDYNIGGRILKFGEDKAVDLMKVECVEVNKNTSGFIPPPPQPVWQYQDREGRLHTVN